MSEPVPPCVFRDLSDEAYRVDLQSGTQTRIDVWLCGWPTTLMNTPKPRWVDRAIGHGLAINPEADCVNCPSRRAI
jgi:phosphotransferase system IIA component